MMRRRSRGDLCLSEGGAGRGGDGVRGRVMEHETNTAASGQRSN